MTFQGNGWTAVVGPLWIELSYCGETVTFSPSELGWADNSEARMFFTRNLGRGIVELINITNAMAEKVQAGKAEHEQLA